MNDQKPNDLTDYSDDSVDQNSGHHTYKIDFELFRQVRDDQFSSFQLSTKQMNGQSARINQLFFANNWQEKNQTSTISKSLYLSITQSTSQSFSAYLNEIKEDNQEIYFLYQALEQLVFPGFAMDHHLITQHYQYESLAVLIPPQYKTYIEAIRAVKGTPLSNMVSLIIAYGVGFGPYVLGNIVTSQLSEVAFFGRLMLSASSIGMGGFLRFWVANQVDAGHGKRAILSLLFLGMIGLIGITALINTIDLQTVHVFDRYYWALFIFNLLSGAGVANYSASVAMSAQCAPNDTPAIWQTRLQKMGIHDPDHLTRYLAPVLRQNAKKYVAMVAGIGSLSPFVTLMTAASLIQYMHLKGIYAFFGSTTLMGILCTKWLLQNSILDQLRNQHVPAHAAKEIASWMGQTLQSNPDLTLLQRLKQLNQQQIHALIVACFNYITTFGLLLAITSTGTLTLSRRGISPSLATYYTAAISGLSSLSRSLMTFHPFHVDSSVITNVGFLVMIPTSLIFALNPDQSIWLPMLLLFSIANGVSNYGVFAQISDTMSEVIGVASGFSGATGAISGFFICIAFALLSSTDKTTGEKINGIKQTTTANAYILATAFCSVSLFLNLVHECHRRPIPTPIPSNSDDLSDVSDSDEILLEEDRSVFCELPMGSV
ncbi:MAG TPA: hypothetical protein DCE78_10350 [Bacteroidetes bacterium]|nr:hypothetical protein [Bacteroidota bacterium]